jgi:GNAT superfamily N-acetyltransferase
MSWHRSTRGRPVIQGAIGEISLRVMTGADIGLVPVACQGSEAELRARINALGSAAVLAFDGDQHVGQLQFRQYERTLRSPDGLWDPLYWGDFGDDAPDLPPQTLSIFCYHVGQLDNSEDRDKRYQGRGLGLALLDFFLGWAKDAGYAAVAAKATPEERAVMAFMGGQPSRVYVDRGFGVVANWTDVQLLDVINEKELVPAGADPDRSAGISCCVKYL